MIKGGSHLCAPNYCRRYRPAARPQMIDNGKCHNGLSMRVRRRTAANRRWEEPMLGRLGALAGTRFYRIFAFAIRRRCGPGSSPNPPTFPFVQYHPMEAGGRIAQAQEKGSRRTSSLFRHSTRWSRNELTRPDNLPRTRLPTGGECYD
jgi:hypothetical protein